MPKKGFSEEFEHRRAPRSTKILDVDCAVEKYPEDLYGEKAKLKVGDTFRAKTINVSETGVLINCDYLFPERTILSLKIPGGKVTEEQIRLKASIAWTKRNAYKIFGRYAAGLHIIEAKKEDIKKLVEHFK